MPTKNTKVQKKKMPAKKTKFYTEVSIESEGGIDGSTYKVHLNERDIVTLDTIIEILCWNHGDVGYEEETMRRELLKTVRDAVELFNKKWEEID